MDENKIKLLKFALKMGKLAIDNFYEISEYCEDLDDEYYEMKEELAKIIGVKYEDISD